MGSVAFTRDDVMNEPHGGFAPATAGANAKGAEIADRIAAIDSGNVTVLSDVALSHLSYGNWYRTQRDYPNALDETRKYHAAMSRFTEGKPHNMEFEDARLRADAFLARALAEADKPEEALVHINAASTLLATVQKINPGLTRFRHEAATIAEAEATAWSDLKDWPRAIAAHKEALSTLEQLQKADPKDDIAHDELLAQRELLAEDLANAGQIPDARASLQSALEMLSETAATRKLSQSELKLQADAEARIAALK